VSVTTFPSLSLLSLPLALSFIFKGLMITQIFVCCGPFYRLDKEARNIFMPDEKGLIILQLSVFKIYVSYNFTFTFNFIKVKIWKQESACNISLKFPFKEIGPTVRPLRRKIQIRILLLFKTLLRGN
jgi:hypothetical protein